MLNKLSLRHIGKGHIWQTYIALHICKLHCRLRLRHLRLLFDQVKNPLRTSDCILKLRNYTGYLIKRLRILVCITQKAGKLAYTERPVDYPDCSCHTDSRVHQAIDKTGSRIGNWWEEHRFQRAWLQPRIYLVKLLHNILRLPECLHNLLVPNHLFNQPCLLPSRLRLQFEHRICALCDKTCHQEGYRRNQHNYQRNLHIHREHETKCPHNRCNSGK